MALDRDGQGDDAPSTRGLSIYGYPQCPYCRRVLNVVSSLGLEIPLRNTRQDADHRRALMDAMGRATVPVLLIEEQAGGSRWLPESADIVRYLAERFGGEG